MRRPARPVWSTAESSSPVRSELETEQPSRELATRLRRFLLKHVVAHQPRLRWAFRVARFAERIGLRRLASATGLLPAMVDRLVPKVPPTEERRELSGVWTASGPRRGRVHLFTGCVMEQVFGRINKATIRLLTANGYDVIVPATQGCCGALLLHDACPAEARKLAERNITAFEEAEVVLHNSAGCGCALGEYNHLIPGKRAEQFASKTRDALDFLAENKLSMTPNRCEQAVTYDAPCHLVHGQKVRGSAEKLLAQVPGIDLRTNTHSDECCGSAGIYNIVHQQLASDIGQRKAQALRATGATIVTTGNPGCIMQIRSHLVGTGVEVRHPIELLLPAQHSMPPQP